MTVLAGRPRDRLRRRDAGAARSRSRSLSDRVDADGDRDDERGRWPKTTVGGGPRLPRAAVGLRADDPRRRDRRGGPGRRARCQPSLARASRRARARRRPRGLRHADLTALPAGRAAGVPVRPRLTACLGGGGRGDGVRGRRRPLRRRVRPGDRRRTTGSPGSVRFPSRRSSSACSAAGGTLRLDGGRHRARPALLDDVTPVPRRRARGRRRSSTLTPTSATTSTGCAAGRDEMLAIFDRVGIARLVRLLPRRARPRARRSRAANDRTLAYAAESRGRDRPVRPARSRRAPGRGGDRCLDLGARGIKLHPRAQSFSLGRRAARPPSSRSRSSAMCRS